MIVSSAKRWACALFAALLVFGMAFAALPSTAYAAAATGSQSVTITDLKEGDTVNLYKVASYTYDAGSDTYSWDFEAPYKDALSAEGITNVNYASADDDKAKEAASIMAGSSASDTPDKTSAVASSATSVSFTFDASDLGLYLVQVVPAAGTTGVVYQNALIDVKPDKASGSWTVATNPASLSMKQSTVSLEKWIVEGGNTVESSDEYGNGDTVTFKIESLIPVYAPEDYANLSYVITDTMSKGLTFESNAPVSVKVDGTDLVVKSDQNPDTYDYEYTYTPGNATNNPAEGAGFKVTLNADALKRYAGKNLVIEYSATVNTNAEQGIKDNAGVDNTSETNGVTLDYGFGVLTDTVTIDTYALAITKVDADDNAKLEGAVFAVYESVAQGTDNAVDLGGGKYGIKIGELKTDQYGVATLGDLGSGTYYLQETTAPDGYQLDATVHEVVISDAEDDDATETVSYTIENKKTPGLPVTGGAGTFALTAGGVILIAAAAALILRSRKSVR